jgi:hypothetical protein
MTRDQRGRSHDRRGRFTAEAVAAERERCARLAESEAAKCRTSDYPADMRIAEAALKNFADLLRNQPEGTPDDT